MTWQKIILMLIVPVVCSQNVCKYPSLSKTSLPTIKPHQYPPPGPIGGECNFASHCDPESCSFFFNRPPHSCDTDCRCINPCNKKKCYGNQICVVAFEGVMAVCLSKPDDNECPKINCGESPCVYGYETDSRGCTTCQCKHPCRNFGCVNGSVCQMLKLTPGSDVLEPKCVVCPKLLKCHKTGLCRGGLKKDSMGCDVCECASCDCPSNITVPNHDIVYNKYDYNNENNKCYQNECVDYLQFNVSSGCDLCRCEPIPCYDKCGGHEICQSRYTDYGRLYGICLPKPSLCGPERCDATKCPHGLQVDPNGCEMPDCKCNDPCDQQKCPVNSFCQLGFCPTNLDCSPAYCTVCPDVRLCNNFCTMGRMLDENGCESCQCRQQECNETYICKGMICLYGKQKSKTTGCEICMCANSPCQVSPCDKGTLCEVEYKNGRPEAVCKGPPTPDHVCPAFNCNHVQCIHGLERDENNCVLNNCQCKDLCKNFDCGTGRRCVEIQGCRDSDLMCRDGYMRSCVLINPLESTTTHLPAAPPKTTRNRKAQGSECPEPEYCPTWCLKKVDENKCQICECAENPDYCKNYDCGKGRKCVIENEHCLGDNCRDNIRKKCIELSVLPTASSTPRPDCPIVSCPSPCSFSQSAFSSSPSSSSCPFCQCPSDCESVDCEVGKVCAMVYQANCYSDCSTIPRCIEKRPELCFMSHAEGSLCFETPVKQWYYNKDQKRCDFFYYNGCEGNENRFVSMDSCKSSCQEITFNCQSNTNCSLSCEFGFKLDSNSCQLCQCVDPCEKTICKSDNMKCEIKDFCSSTQSSCLPTHVPTCECSNEKSCEIRCPYGKVKDAGGCETCECYDPCKNLMCGDEQLCAITSHESCNEKQCSSEVKGECVDALMKKNFRIMVNASYDIFILNDMKSYNDKIKNILSKHYKVPSKNVYILKHEKGSIITTAHVIIDNNDSDIQGELNTFDVSIEDKNFKASVISEKDSTPSKVNNKEEKKKLSKKNKMIILILCCVGIPVCFVIIVPLVFMYKKRHRCDTLNRHILKSYPSNLSAPSQDNLKSVKPIQIREKSVDALTNARITSFTEA